MSPKHYACPKVVGPVKLSGKLDDPAWAKAPWTDDFVDILGPDATKPRFRTRAKMLWTDEFLYIGAELEEPHVWATLTEHDCVIFHDNDFEVFLDPDGDNHLYSELELNALNTTWDLLLIRPYRNGGPPVDGWEIAGMKTAVHVDGTLNDPSDTDKGWSLEIAIPWRALIQIAGRELPPKPNETMRINFSRVEWHTDIVDGKYKKVPNKPEDNWVWSPIGAIDMHRPEKWGILEFCDGPSLHPTVAKEADTLMDVYHAQQAFRAKSGRWATRGTELNLGDVPGLVIEATTSMFEARIGSWRIDHESRLRKV